MKVEQFKHNFVRLSVVAPHPGFVYMSESFLPGWTATVNGHDVPIQPANYAFRAVAVPAGPVDVRLNYVPPGLVPGLAIAGPAWLIVAMLLALGHRRRHASQPAVHERVESATLSPL